MITCGVCNLEFPSEHAFVCLIGTTLCPPCQVRQRRFSISSNVASYEASVPYERMYNGGVNPPDMFCEMREDCPCNECSYQRGCQTAEALVQEREDELYARIKACAELPFYKERAQSILAT